MHYQKVEMVKEKEQRTIIDQYKDNQFVQDFFNKSLQPDSDLESQKSEQDLGNTEDEIERLFLSLKEECERDHVKPEPPPLFDIEEEVESPSVTSPKTQISQTPTSPNIISTERTETKGNVKITIKSMGPQKYFKESPLPSPVASNSRRKNERKSQRFKAKQFLAQNPQVLDQVLHLILNIRLNNQSYEELRIQRAQNQIHWKVYQKKLNNLQESYNDYINELNFIKQKLTESICRNIDKYINSKSLSLNEKLEHEFQKEILKNKVFNRNKMQISPLSILKMIPFEKRVPFEQKSKFDWRKFRTEIMKM